MSIAAEQRYDVIIVGAGAAGSVYAALLAEAGKQVLVLESGPERRMQDLYSSQIWARRLKWTAPEVADTQEPIWFNMNAGRGTGGAAIHHYGVWPRLHPEDFRMHSLYGKGLDWPIAYDDLRPYYDRVQEEVGVSGDAKQEIWRPPGAPYPLPPVARFRHGDLLAEGFRKREIPTSPIPLAVLSQPYKGRSACLWDGWCDAGCPIGALANPLVEYVPRARSAGAEYRSDCHVARVLLNKRGDRASGVEYFDRQGKTVRVLADAVVLAAFTVENVRILFNSADDLHPRGLGNGSDLLGRYLMVHPAITVLGLFDDAVYNYMGATGGQLFSQHGFAKDQHAGAAFGSRQWEIALALKPNDLLGIAMTRPDLFGTELDAFMHRASRGLAAMVNVCEDFPQRENRIEPATEKDRFGIRRVRSVYRMSPSGRALAEQGAAEGMEVMRAAGAVETWHGPIGGQHIMGGTLMGESVTDSVTDAWCALHEAPNVFIGGAGTYATSSSVNTTFSIHALAMRSAERMIATWSDISA